MPTLKQTLAVDAIGAALSVLLLLGFTHEIAQLTGLPATVVAVAGWICVPSAVLFAHQALRPSRGLLTLVVAGNVGWVLASIVVWIANFGQLTAAGHAIMIAQAIAVEILATLEWRGLRSLSPRAVVA